MSRIPVLCVDDEPRILSFISRGLWAEGFRVDTASTRAAALESARAGWYGAVLLDLLMPDVDGQQLLLDVVAIDHDAPVIVLSCVGDPAVKVECLAGGAVDYLEKPFLVDELVARLRLRMRQPAGDADPPVPDAPPGPSRTLSTPGGTLALDLVNRTVYRAGEQVRLTDREFQLVRMLLASVGETVSKERLLSGVWGLDFDPRSNVVDVCVRRVREKLGHHVVTTVRGHGYRIDAR